MAKVKLTAMVSEDVAEQARNAAAFLAGNPAYLSLGSLIENALRAELARLQKEHNKGKPFPDGKIRTGRPVGSKADA